MQARRILCPHEPSADFPPLTDAVKPLKLYAGPHEEAVLRACVQKYPAGSPLRSKGLTVRDHFHEEGLLVSNSWPERQQPPDDQLNLSTSCLAVDETWRSSSKCQTRPLKPLRQKVLTFTESASACLWSIPSSFTTKTSLSQQTKRKALLPPAFQSLCSPPFSRVGKHLYDPLGM